MSLDELLARLGSRQLSKKGLIYDPIAALQQGRFLFDSMKQRLYQKVCTEWDFCAKRSDPSLNDSVSLIAVLGDIIATATIGFPPVLVATILVKKGLTSFCGCDKAMDR